MSVRVGEGSVEPEDIDYVNCWLEPTRCIDCRLVTLAPDKASSPEEQEQAREVLWRAVCAVRKFRGKPANLGKKPGKRSATDFERNVWDRVGRTHPVAVNAVIDTIHYQNSGNCIAPEDSNNDSGIPSNYAGCIDEYQ